MVLQLWEEATQKFLFFNYLKKYEILWQESLSVSGHKMRFIYLQNFCLKTFCTSVIFPKLEMSVERSFR